MKVLQINATCGTGSTGKICLSIGRALDSAGIENYVLYSTGTCADGRAIKYSNQPYQRFQALKSRILGNYGFGARASTKRLISYLDELKLDIVHLHNIHSHDCNLETLFCYFKKNKTKLVWTFHDCWAFTAYCPYFDMVHCSAWKSKCVKCPQRRTYSWFFDRSKELYQKKKALLSGLDLTIVTPSQWLADLVQQSFLADYPTYVINNGIDLSIFHPAESNFREKYQLQNKYIVLGVAFDWGARKGLDVFISLSERLPDHYQIVLVGTNDRIDRELPENILSIHRTQNQQELAQIYTAADVYVNPTREDNYPTVNMEAIACGTPVITFRTGGSPEMLDDTCGIVVSLDDVNTLQEEIVRVCETRPFTREDCMEKAKQFDMNERYKEYVALYERINAE